ncbi:MAG TPA: phosphopantothenate/pantothenate synthetase [Candidatus Diapherotrites archaeon]|uniref:4-phosphopantoate--beta-alanine ligase n=1 Tax=Candidatus Iainarchaeum sp. TaxID=3101447 RepID=A0A7J4IVX1_9ARCH|nr:phosphopantothenate/pantothenate synthetase [Candidatus Diapherotrites archaeon]
MTIPADHPRKRSLEERHKMEQAFLKGIVAATGMIAHGRGEALDYFLGEKTSAQAKVQIEAAAAKLILAKWPVISVNGNATALCAREITELAKAADAKIEVNLFYRTPQRISLIEKEFAKLGAKILGTNPAKKIPGLNSKRGLADKNGIWKADVVLVMLEDGDRTGALRKAGKFVIAIDLNPISRTAKKANITIVDNITRCIPLLAEKVNGLKGKKIAQLQKILSEYNNKKMLRKSEMRIRKGVRERGA